MLVEELALKTWTIDSVTEGKVECEVHLQVVDRIDGEDVLLIISTFFIVEISKVISAVTRGGRGVQGLKREI